MASASDSEEKEAADGRRLENLIVSSARAIFSRCRLSFPLVAAMIAYGVVLFTPALLNDPDTYWHIETGQWILEHYSVPRVDPFSFTMAGHPWVAHEWLSEVLMALAYRALGWNGVVMLFGAAAATTVGCLAQYLAQRMRLLAATITLTLGASCVGPSLLARPHLLALPLLALWTIGLLRAQERRAPPPLRLLPLMLIWANLHASFILGLALVAPIALDALTDAKHDAWYVARNWTLFFAAAFATALLTPHGWHGLLFPFQLMGMQVDSSIGEWRPLDLNSLHPIEAALAALLYVVVSRRLRMSAPRLLIVAALLYLAFRHSRHEMVAGIVGTAVLAAPLGRAFGSTPRAPAARRLPWRDVAVGLACVALLTALRLAHHVERGDGPISPVAALAAVPPELLAAPVFNSYDFGGYLIFRHVRPFVDGRADMYGDAFMSAYIDATRPDSAAFERLVGKYRIRWALLATQSAVAQMVATLPEWRRIHTDDVAIVFVHDAP
jgi:hypothetical protein